MFPILIFQGEVARYKRKGKEANLEIVKLRKDLEDMKNAEIKALQVKKELMLKANVASEAAESLQMANNISANLDSNSKTQDLPRIRPRLVSSLKTTECELKRMPPPP